MDPSTASRAPSTFLASATASTGRSSALLGTQPQYEHSPPTSSRSTTATDSPAARLRSVTFCPTGPAPITMTSYVSSIVGFLSSGERKVVDRGYQLGAWRGRRRVSGGRDMEFRELAAFVAIVEQGGLSAAPYQPTRAVADSQQPRTRAGRQTAGSKQHRRGANRGGDNAPGGGARGAGAPRSSAGDDGRIDHRRGQRHPARHPAGVGSGRAAARVGPLHRKIS